MYTIITANKEKNISQIRELSLEYLQWINMHLLEMFAMGIDDVPGKVEDDLAHLDKFLPPTGRFLLVYADENPVGMGGLKYLEPGVGEIKRMYVRPAYRRQGMGRAIIHRLFEEATKLGYMRLRLDTAPFLPESHQLYRSAGFQEIQPYEGSEVPHEFHYNWKFMEKEL